MGWIRVEDDFYDNEKMLAAGSIGRDLYWHGMGFCNRNLTDGLIPKRRALTLVDFTDAAVLDGLGGADGQACAPVAVQRLLDADLWHEDGHNCPSCPQPGPRNYIVHDYLKYQPSRAQVEAKRTEAKDRMAKARESRSQHVRANIERTSHEVGLTPNPNPNPNTSLVDLGGELTQVRADAPPPICPRHGETNSQKPCRACQERREWQKEQDRIHERDQLEERRLLKAQREACPLCDENGMIEIAGGLARCDHMADIAHA